ncbi:MAG: glutaredoxin domain-containing protein [Terriglobia bacterium]
MPRLELYGSSTCPYTRDLRDWLEWRGVEFAEYDVEMDRAARARIQALVPGTLTVPTLVEDGRVTRIGWQGRGCVIAGG